MKLGKPFRRHISKIKQDLRQELGLKRIETRFTRSIFAFQAAKEGVRPSRFNRLLSPDQRNELGYSASKHDALAATPRKTKKTHVTTPIFMNPEPTMIEYLLLGQEAGKKKKILQQRKINVVNELAHAAYFEAQHQIGVKNPNKEINEAFAVSFQFDWMARNMPEAHQTWQKAMVEGGNALYPEHIKATEFTLLLLRRFPRIQDREKARKRLAFTRLDSFEDALEFVKSMRI